MGPKHVIGNAANPLITKTSSTVVAIRCSPLSTRFLAPSTSCFIDSRPNQSAKNLRQLDLPGPVLHYIVRKVIEVEPQNLPSHSQAYFIVVVLLAVSANVHRYSLSLLLYLMPTSNRASSSNLTEDAAIVVDCHQR